MSSFKKIALGVAVGAAIGALFITFMAHQKDTRESLVASLKDFVLDVEVSELSTRELRLRQYAMLAQFDPLFAFPGTDIAKLKTAIEELLPTRDTFAQYYTEEEGGAIRRGLYPVSFLSLIPETEAARRTLVENPTIKSAREYHERLEALMNAYVNEIETLREILETQKSSEVHYWNGVSTPAFIIGVLEKLQVEVSNAIAEEKTRYACSAFTVRLCDLFAHTTAEKRVREGRTPTAVAEIPPHVREHLSILRTVLSSGALGEEQPLEEIKTNSLDTVVVSDSAFCTPTFGRVHFALWWNTVSSASTFESAGLALLDDLYFYDLARSTDNYGQSLHETGLEYDLQKINPYLCLEFGYDSGNLLSAYYLSSKLTETPIFSELSDDDIERAPRIVADLQQLEQRIRSHSFVHVDEIEAFAHMAEVLLFTQGRMYLHTLLGAERRAAFEHIILTWNTQTAWAEDAVARLSYITNATLAALDRLEIPLGVFFLTRSHLSSLYFLGNTTIASRPYSLVQTRSEIEPENFDLITYRNDLRARYTPEAMASYLLDAEKVVLDFITTRIPR